MHTVKKFIDNICIHNNMGNIPGFSNIHNTEVREVISTGEIIEDYPEDKRGHSCLMMSYSRMGRPVHVVCAPKETYLAIVTAYVPSLDKWEEDFKVRRKQS